MHKLKLSSGTVVTGRKMRLSRHFQIQGCRHCADIFFLLCTYSSDMSVLGALVEKPDSYSAGFNGLSYVPVSDYVLMVIIIF